MTLNMLHVILRFANLVLGVVCLLVCWYAVREGNWLWAFVEAMIAVYALYQSLSSIRITMRITPIMDKDEDAYRMLDGISKAVSDSLPENLKLYVLEGHEPRPVKNLVYWAMRRDKDYHLALTSVGEVEISTVFLGMDCNYHEGHAPLLFETMIFGGVHSGDQMRSATWDEAMSTHEDICAMVRGGTDGGRKK